MLSERYRTAIGNDMRQHQEVQQWIDTTAASARLFALLLRPVKGRKSRIDVSGLKVASNKAR